MYKHIQFKVGIDLPYRTKVGKGLKIMHFGGVVVSEDANIGDYCTIYQCVTIGKRSKNGAPIIGDNCCFFAGAKILGNIKIGDGVIVGANAVVLSDCPDKAVVAGVPAKVLKIKKN